VKGGSQIYLQVSVILVFRQPTNGHNPATSFVKWASDFLSVNRVVETFFVDANHGFRLANNDLVVLCPGIELQGTMQESYAIPIVAEERKGKDVQSSGTNIRI